MKKIGTHEILDQILIKAAELSVDSVDIEYTDGGDLEVMFVKGSSCGGSVIEDRVTQRRLIRAIVERAGLEKKSRGAFAWRREGEEYDIAVREHDSFGEAAFSLKIRKSREGRLKDKKTSGNYQLKLVLADSDPAIWRRVVVDGAISLPELHDVIQAAMGWTNSHLHQFKRKNAWLLA